MTAVLMHYLSSPWLWGAIVLAYCITILSIVGVVLSENRNPLKSLAWVCVLIMFPIGGLVLYIFFGRSIKNTRMISRRKRRRLMRNEATPSQPQQSRETCALGAEERQYVRLAQNLTGAPLFTDNRVIIYHSGEEKLEALLEDISRARSFVHLQYYIIENDSTGERLGDALLAKAAEGVKVRVIYDDIGSMHLSRRYLKRLREAGIEIFPFSRVAFPPFATRINWRNHRKLCVIDDVVGYIGGMNIADRYMNGGRSFSAWHDTHLRISGPAVAALQYSFAVDWNFMGRPLLDAPEGHGIVTTPPLDVIAGMKADIQMVTSGPTSRWSNVAMMMLKAISNAKRLVYIQTPYFLPTESLLKALQAAALSRVDVRVMIPARSDSLMLTHASRSYVQECLRAGIKIYFYEGGMLHSKTMVVDDSFATVGSTNFDFRSFEHNFESNVLIYSREVNEALRGEFLENQKTSTRIVLGPWRRRPWHLKAAESLIRLLSPIL